MRRVGESIARTFAEINGYQEQQRIIDDSPLAENGGPHTHAGAAQLDLRGNTEHMENDESEEAAKRTRENSQKARAAKKRTVETHGHVQEKKWLEPTRRSCNRNEKQTREYNSRAAAKHAKLSSSPCVPMLPALLPFTHSHSRKLPDDATL